MTRRRAAHLIGALGLAVGASMITATDHAAQPNELVVFAAASLREAFTTLAKTFEAQHPGVKVELSFAGSQELRVQIEHGARADVFASADEKHVAALERQSMVRNTVLFAHNELVVIVPANNPAKLAAFSDLPKATRIVLGVPEVPIGAYSERILTAADKRYGGNFGAQVRAHVRSRELNVKQVLTKVVLGEADAGVVYRTDAQAEKDRVAAISIPSDINLLANYPIASLAGAPHPELARAWLDLVRSKEGQRVLASKGFKALSERELDKGLP
jgi:molybdate transport system substrate-binding protein